MATEVNHVIFLHCEYTARGMSFDVDPHFANLLPSIPDVSSATLIEHTRQGGVSYPVERASQEEDREPLSPHNRKISSSVSLMRRF